jgi:microcystin-dependent protein
LNVIGIGDVGWGPPLNSNANIIDKALGSFDTISGTSGNITLTPAQYQNMCLKSDTAAFFATVTYIIPSAVAGQWVVINQSAASSFDLRIKNAANAAFVTIPRGEARLVYSDGTTVVFSETRQVIPNMEIAPGAIVMFATGSAPTGWLSANGAAVSRTTYAALFAVIGTYYGAGNGSTTFNVPDLRGEFLRSLDEGRGIDPGRTLGSVQGDAIRNMTGTFSTGALAANFTGVFAAGANVGRIGGSPDLTGQRVSFNASLQVPTAAENRPRNVALNTCIKF